MDASWFDPEKLAWLPGTAFGCLGGLLGALAGILAPQGKARRLVLGAWIAMMVASWCLLALGLLAMAIGQPRGVWYGLFLPGLQGSIILPVLYPILRKRYREAEARKMEAEDLGF